MAQWTRTIDSTRLQESSNANAMIADVGTILCNRPDARVANLDVLQ